MDHNQLRAKLVIASLKRPDYGTNGEKPVCVLVKVWSEQDQAYSTEDTVDIQEVWFDEALDCWVIGLNQPDIE